MAILKIARMGHPILMCRAKEVDDPDTSENRYMVRDLIETMADARGLGLAAPQIHISKRVVVFHAPADEHKRSSEELPERELTVLFNPIIEPVSNEIVFGWEGCLSVPDLRGEVPRYAAIRYRGITFDGKKIDRTVHGMHARVVQHECDHLDGILYPMRMTDMSKLVFESEFHHLFENARDPESHQDDTEEELLNG
jgi:peptide deformylase